MKFLNKSGRNRGRTCLFAAVRHMHAENVKRLLSLKEIDVNKCNRDRVTPLHNACMGGDLEIIRVKSFFMLSFNCALVPQKSVRNN